MIDRMMPVLKTLFALTFTSGAVAHRVNRRLSEWHLAIVMLLVGIVIEAGNTFALAPYEVVRQMADQSTWAMVMIAVGGGRLAVLIVNGALPRCTGHLRYTLASASAVVWAIMLAGLLSFGTPLMVGPFLAMAVVVDLVSAFRAAQDARLIDEESGAGDDKQPR